MQTVRVHKATLTAKITANCAAHGELHEEAMTGWRREARAELRRRLADLDNGGQPDLLVRLPPPENHTAEYLTVLEMLEMSVEDEVEITTSEFRQFVQDKWDWQERFSLAHTRYTTVTGG